MKQANRVGYVLFAALALSAAYPIFMALVLPPERFVVVALVVALTFGRLWAHREANPFWKHWNRTTY